MLDLQMTTGCDVLILPERGRARSIWTARSNIALADAVRFVVEDLSLDARERAVVRTPRGNVFANEATGLYALLGGRRQAAEGLAPPVSGMTGRPAATEEAGCPAPERAGAFSPARDSQLPSATRHHSGSG